MASRGQRVTVKSQDNPYSDDRIALLDLDELVSQLNAKKNSRLALEQELETVKQQCAMCITVLSCTEAEQLPEPHSTLVPQLSNELLQQWAGLEIQVSLHKFLGTEVMSHSIDITLFKIHAYEKNYPTLPNKIYRINKIPDSEFFRIKPKEISFYLERPKSLIQLMVKSNKKDLVSCFQMTQSFIYDLVKRENLYQFLRGNKLIQDNVQCSRNRTVISFNLPITSSSPLIRRTKELIPAEALLHDNIGISLRYNSQETSDSPWEAQIYCSDDPDLANLPYTLSQILQEFMLTVPVKPIEECLHRLLEKCSLQHEPQLSSSSSSNSDNEFALF